MKNFNACNEFFILIVESHIIAVAMKILGMTSVADVPNSPLVPDADALWTEPDEKRKQVLHTINIAMKIVDSFINLRFNTCNSEQHMSDELNVYTKCLFSLRCLYLEFSDAIKEGDGDCVLRCWRYMLPIFVSSRRTNYAIESLNLLVQHDFLLPPRLAAELIWGRFINVQGLPGRNIPNDLYMEHMNCVIKQSIKNLGANKTEQAICKVGKAVGVITPILDNFDEANCVAQV